MLFSFNTLALFGAGMSEGGINSLCGLQPAFVCHLGHFFMLMENVLPVEIAYVFFNHINKIDLFDVNSK